jgi:phosphoribosylformylglycinamidine synthase
MGSTIQQEATLEEAIGLGLKADEFEMIKKILGRTPNFTETSIYSAFWSEHCSYRNAIYWLKTLPIHKGKDAGMVNLGDNFGCVLNINSDNHQSKTTPRMNRSPFSMEVETIAQVNSLRLGNIENDSTKLFLKKVTKEISDSVIPTIKENVFFDDSFNTNPLVNSFTVGIIDSNKSTSADLGIEQPSYTIDFCSEKVIKDITAKFDLKAEDIRINTDTINIRCFNVKDIIADIPVESLLKGNEASVNEQEVEAPDYFQAFKDFDINEVKEPDDLKEAATFLLKHPNIASKKSVFNQRYTKTSKNSDKINAPADAEIVHIQGTGRALAVTLDCNSRYVHADPEIGTSIAVAEAARNIVCAGGTPNAIATSLNFANPNNPASNWQFTNVVKGMLAACKKFKTPVTGGNLSFYNSTSIEGKDVSTFASPIIGMTGLLENKEKAMTLDFKHKGDLIFIIGEAVECIGSSEYLNSYHGIKASPAPYFNMEKEIEMQEVIKSLINNDLVSSAHDCSYGGLFITLTEMAIPNELGFDIVSDAEIREDAFLFGESAGRVIVGVNEGSEDVFIEFMINAGVNFTLLGHVTQGKMVIDDDHYGFIQEAKKSYNTTLEKLIE